MFKNLILSIFVLSIISIEGYVPSIGENCDNLVYNNKNLEKRIVIFSVKKINKKVSKITKGYSYDDIINFHIYFKLPKNANELLSVNDSFVFYNNEKFLYMSDLSPPNIKI
jgi:hypothetical protein